MSVPKKQQSKARTRKRRSHNALKTKTLGVCEKCKSAKMPNRVCETCGTYKGKQVLNMDKKSKKIAA